MDGEQSEIPIVISIDCSAQNWDFGHASCGAMSFMGIDSSGQMRFCFCWSSSLLKIGVLVIDGCDCNVCLDRTPLSLFRHLVPIQ